MATAQITPSRSALLDNVDWHTYSRLIWAFRDRPSFRLTYDRGKLEIMSPSFAHESPVDLLGRFVVVLTEELRLPIKAAGSTTLRRRRLRRGLEADRSWWIVNEPRMRGKLKLDLRVDPPPDLALEVEVTRRVLDRISIYAALRVPEIWRSDGKTLSFHVLGADGRYVEQNHSLAFPQVTPSDLLRFLPLRATLDENAVVAQFRAWVRQHVASRGSSPSQPASPTD